MTRVVSGKLRLETTGFGANGSGGYNSHSEAEYAVPLPKNFLPKLSDSCGRNVHLRIKEAFVLTLLVEWWTERRNCLVTTLFSALNAATWTRKAVLVHTPSVAMADQWVCY
jgi:hypothetical protein